jgi:hypothetical protein
VSVVISYWEISESRIGSKDKTWFGPGIDTPNAALSGPPAARASVAIARGVQGTEELARNRS